MRHFLMAWLVLGGPFYIAQMYVSLAVQYIQSYISTRMSMEVSN